METKLARSIGLQARVLRELAASSFAEQASVLADAQRLVMIGTGSSLHAAQLGAWHLRRRGIDAVAMSSACLARWEPPTRPGDAIVVISHTGQTAYSVRARADALTAGTPLVSITGAGADWPEAIIAGPAEASETYTVSYLASLAVVARLRDGIEAVRGGASIRPASLTLLDAADRVQSAIDAPDVAHIGVPTRAAALVGSGPWSITAAEGALKLREAARVLAEAYDAETLLHGSAAPLTEADTLIALQPAADPDGLIDGLAAAAHAEGVHVVTIEDERPLADPFYAQFSLTVRLQQLAAHFAERRGQNPDDVIVGCWNADSLWNAGKPAVHVS
ncbi:SIS domain-containing protein [Gryllotalpicola protaetiae]|uniref:Glutamine--fructose-6-phosphate aminotransferase [isomerizing] n=1 Tax=Gryllotalpicola protaetiae TaxID=2419771 RepID=A0A387BI31_9MICO|nr:SIS domain-containing protein [Gryllotalpicola protaetiae]AYG03483.1 SIS domain-containing protein [Gryllotalpicola protaetiae]